VNCRPTSQVVCLAAGALLSFAILPANAGPVAGATTCGAYVTRAPSTLGRSGSGMVPTALAVKQLTDFRDALICLINAERTKDGKPQLTRNKQLDMAALGHTSEAQRLKWWGTGNPHVHPDKGPRDAGQAHRAADTRRRLLPRRSDAGERDRLQLGGQGKRREPRWPDAGRRRQLVDEHQQERSP
jgi:hypothetical protein